MQQTRVRVRSFHVHVVAKSDYADGMSYIYALIRNSRRSFSFARSSFLIPPARMLARTRNIQCEAVRGEHVCTL